MLDRCIYSLYSLLSGLELTMTWADVIATWPVWTPVPLHSYLPPSSGLTFGITSMDLFLE